MTVLELKKSLIERRAELEMPCSALARRSGLSLRTVQRAMDAANDRVDVRTLLALAQAMDVTVAFSVNEVAANRVLTTQADRKANELVSATQGSSALEGQAVSAQALTRLKSRSRERLLGGSRRKLWAA